MAGFWMLQVNLGDFGGDIELPEAQGSVQLGPRRSQEVRGGPELQNNGLRAPRERFLSELHVAARVGSNSDRFGGSLEVPEAQGGVQLGRWKSYEVRGSLELQTGALRAPWECFSSELHVAARFGIIWLHLGII